MKILAFALFAALIGLPAIAAPRAVAATSVTALPDCSGRAAVKPSHVVLTCADAGISAAGLHWTGWGNAFAAGVGVASVNDCKPYCAAGHFHRYRIVLLASGRQRCPNGRDAYDRVTYAWIGRSPYAQNGANTPDPVIPYRCR